MPDEERTGPATAACIVHVALYVQDLDRSCAFYEEHVGARCGPVYLNARTAGFSSRFVTLPGGGPGNPIEITTTGSPHTEVP